MKVKDSKVFREMQDGRDKTFKVKDGSPALPQDVVEKYSQEIRDLLADKGFTYMNCVVILMIAQGVLREERDIKRL